MNDGFVGGRLHCRSYSEDYGNGERGVGKVEKKYNPSRHREDNVDLRKIPESTFSGLKKGGGESAHLHAEDLEGEDTEVWIVQCTKNVNLEDILKNKKLYLDSERPIRLFDEENNDRDFESICVPLDNEQKGNIASLLPDNDGKLKLVSTPLSGYIMLRESINELPAPFFNTDPPPLHELPSGLKHRHPVYGVDFSELLTNMENTSDSELFTRKSKKSKKSKRNEFDQNTLYYNGNISNVLEDEVDNNKLSSSSTKSKEPQNDNISYDWETPPEYTEDEPSTIIPAGKKKKKKSRNILVATPEPDIISAEEPEETRRKKRKKNKRNEPSQLEPIPVKFEVELSDYEHEHLSKKSKKKRKLEEAIEPVRQKKSKQDVEQNGYQEVTLNQTSPMKKKRKLEEAVEPVRQKKSKRKDVEQNGYQEVPLNDILPMKKKKKKHHIE